MGEKGDFCQYYYKDMELATLPDDRVALPLRRYWWTLKRFVWLASYLGVSESFSRYLSIRFKGFSRKKRKIRFLDEVNDLKQGDWVEVRSAKEILATLDAKGKLKGLTFTPEMIKFCGKRFRVYKKLDRIILEATGELRKIKSPTVLLDYVFCDGSAHGACDRSCFCFWRQEWLKKILLTGQK
jgi:hypothetical protein